MSQATQLKPPPLKTVPDCPPAPTADRVLDQRAEKERELAALETKIGETAYSAVVAGQIGSRALADLQAKIQAARFELECNSAAHAHAIEVDRAAVSAWWQAVHAMPPEEAIAGISKTECCRRCTEANGCVITGSECAHPLKAGWNLNPRHQGNPGVRRLQRAAAQQLGVLR